MKTVNCNPNCYIFGAGEYYGAAPAPAPPGYIIAADGGLAYLESHAIKPNLVIGDFDSLGKRPAGDYELIILPVEKDDTDMAAAMREGWSRGFRVFHIYGGTGGRVDHTLANISLIANLAAMGGHACLYDRDTVITAIHNDSISFSPDMRGIISVFSYTDISRGITEQGLKYKLTNAIMANTNPNGVSNEFTGEPATISVADGTLIITYPEVNIDGRR